jgi:hypothetical protein
MKAAGISYAIPDGSASHSAARNMVESWAEAVDGFRQWQRKEIIEKEPSAAQLAEHRRALTWMLRWTRAVQMLVADPEFPAREFGPEVAGRLLQLEESWGLIHDPMTDAEADAILHDAFPGASGTNRLIKAETASR